LWGSGWDRGEEIFATIPMIGAIWFLLALFFSRTIYSCLKQYTQPLTRILLILLLYSFGLISALYIRLPLSIQAGLCAILFVWIGDEIRQRQILEQTPMIHKGILFGLLIVWFTNLFIDPRISMVVAHMGFNIIGLLAATFASISLIVLCKNFNWKGGWIGRNTLYILCAHSIAPRYHTLTAGRYNIYCPSSELLSLALEIAFNVSAALILAYIMKRLRILEWPGNWRKRMN